MNMKVFVDRSILRHFDGSRVWMFTDPSSLGILWFPERGCNNRKNVQYIRICVSLTVESGISDIFNLIVPSKLGLAHTIINGKILKL